MDCVVSDSSLCKLKLYLTNERVGNSNSNPTGLLSVFNKSDQMYMNMAMTLQLTFVCLWKKAK